MRVLRSAIDQGPERSVVTVGTFDGVHRAHLDIIRQMRSDAVALNAQTCVVTFDPHPQSVLHSRPSEVKLLTTLDERLALLEAAGVDATLVMEFTKEFSQTPPEEFVGAVLVDRLHAVRVVVGHDHGFGKGRAGDLELLERIGKEHGFSVDAIDAMVLDGAPVGSTRIRQALTSGRIDEANMLLGQCYDLHGTVVHGDQLGAKIGFPTANIVVDSKAKLIPADGVYAVNIEIDGEQFCGMMNIGVRPTVSAGLQHTMEVNIFDFSRQIYGSPIRVSFVARIRDEKKFPSLDALKEQLAQDHNTSVQLLEQQNLKR